MSFEGVKLPPSPARVARQMYEPRYDQGMMLGSMLRRDMSMRNPSMSRYLFNVTRMDGECTHGDESVECRVLGLAHEASRADLAGGYSASYITVEALGQLSQPCSAVSHRRSIRQCGDRHISRPRSVV